MEYRHVDVIARQRAKHDGRLCGDVIDTLRNERATAVLLCDGLGSGAPAHMAAQWFASRTLHLLREGSSQRKAFDAILHTLHENRGQDRPWAALMLARVRRDGETTVLSHEMPGPLLLSAGHATPLPAHASVREGSVLDETLCHLRPGEALLLVSDGVAQSGLGRRPGEWRQDDYAQAVTRMLRAGTPLEQIPGCILNEASARWGGSPGDDCSAVLLHCREGLVVNLLTGPPADRTRDASAVQSFLQADGMKVVCGSTTASIVARTTGAAVKVEQKNANPLVPPAYRLEGIDLVTEGAVTISQVCRILDADLSHWSESHGVSQLASLLQAADCVRITVGLAANAANDDMLYRQLGVLPRRDLVRVLAEKLERAGKLVSVRYV